MKVNSGRVVDASVADALDILDEALSDAGTGSASTSKKMRAYEVPVGGVFGWNGKTWVRTDGKGHKTGRQYIVLNKPCKAVSTDGKVVGLNKATVTFYPEAHLTV